MKDKMNCGRPAREIGKSVNALLPEGIAAMLQKRKLTTQHASFPQKRESRDFIGPYNPGYPLVREWRIWILRLFASSTNFAIVKDNDYVTYLLLLFYRHNVACIEILRKINGLKTKEKALS